MRRQSVARARKSSADYYAFVAAEDDGKLARAARVVRAGKTLGKLTDGDLPPLPRSRAFDARRQSAEQA